MKYILSINVDGFVEFLNFDIETGERFLNSIHTVSMSGNIDKLYYSIGEVAKMFNVNTSLIRFWEKEFDIIKPHKNKKGNRLFTKADVDNFHIIYHLVKERGFTLQGARQKLKENKEEVVNSAEIVKSLTRIKEFLLEIKQQL